jgi:hypothetical protein
MKAEKNSRGQYENGAFPNREEAEAHYLDERSDTIVVDPALDKTELYLGPPNVGRPILILPGDQMPELGAKFIACQEGADSVVAIGGASHPDTVALGNDVTPGFVFGLATEPDHCLLRLEYGKVRVIDYSPSGTTVMLSDWQESENGFAAAA